jgi:hypothetical protein
MRGQLFSLNQLLHFLYQTRVLGVSIWLGQ